MFGDNLISGTISLVTHLATIFAASFSNVQTQLGSTGWKGGTQLQERSMRKRQSSNQLTWLSRILSGCKNGLENNPIPDNHWKGTKLSEPNLFNFKCKSVENFKWKSERIEAKLRELQNTLRSQIHVLAIYSIV